MPTRHDFLDALMEGRWRPNVEVERSKDGFTARYVQGDKVIEKSSPYSEFQAVQDVKREIREGVLKGMYYPPSQV
jgi:hypothetical protein